MSPTTAALLTPKPEPPDGPSNMISPAEEYSDIYAEFLRVLGRFSAALSRRTASSPRLPIVPSPSSAPPARVPSPAPPRAAAAWSSEMVRVAALDAEQERHFRGVVRRTRMTDEALRIFISRGEGRAVEQQLGVPRAAPAGRLEGGDGDEAQGDVVEPGVVHRWLHPRCLRRRRLLLPDGAVRGGAARPDSGRHRLRRPLPDPQR